MKVPLEITYRGVQKTDYIEGLIREKAAKLDQVCDHLISCRVVVESPQPHQRTGNPLRVRVDMRIPPGHEIVVSRESSDGNPHDILPVVVRDVFEAARRQLKKVLQRQKGEVKFHPEQESNAFVSKIFREEGYGFVKSLDGREIYFHRNSVIEDGFEDLEVGTGVRYVEEVGEKGPQASTVQILEKSRG